MIRHTPPFAYALLLSLTVATSAQAQETRAALITASQARKAAAIAAEKLRLAADAAAQDPLPAEQTRFAEIAAEQARKAAESTPYVPSTAERWAVMARREFLSDPSGFYPYFASVYSGGGLTLGGGYRQFYGDRTHWDVKGLYSLKNYKLIELSTDSWSQAGGRFDVHARFGWRDATQVAYHGLGMATPNENTQFRLKQTYVGGEMRIHPGRITVIGLGLTYDDYSLGSGTGSEPCSRPRPRPGSATVRSTCTHPSRGAWTGGLRPVTHGAADSIR
jgi:hypothetical protein